MIGREFGRWKVVAQAEPRIYGGRKHDQYHCECSCEAATRRPVLGNSLRGGHSQSCGCLLVESGRRNGKAAVADLSKRRFGHLRVERRAENRGRHVQWLCSCACGEEAKVDAHALTSGNTRSCGCVVGKRLTPNQRLERTRARLSARSSRRRAAQFLAHRPFDADAFTDLERRLFDLAQRLTAFTGDWWVVDHIVPLVGPKLPELGCRAVCGLHNEHNLQVIRQATNLKKSNRRWPHMAKWS